MQVTRYKIHLTDSSSGTQWVPGSGVKVYTYLSS